MRARCGIAPEHGGSGAPGERLEAYYSGSFAIQANQSEGEEMNYPSKDELEAVLRTLAKQAGDPSTRPFRIDPLPVHGGGSPMYTVVLLSQQKSLLREKLSDVLHRSFAVGTGSFVLKASEVVTLISHGAQQPHDGPAN
jgi:hypothetical protein